MHFAVLLRMLVRRQGHTREDRKKRCSETFFCCALLCFRCVVPDATDGQTASSLLRQHRAVRAMRRFILKIGAFRENILTLQIKIDIIAVNQCGHSSAVIRGQKKVLTGDAGSVCPDREISAAHFDSYTNAVYYIQKYIRRRKLRRFSAPCR